MAQEKITTRNTKAEILAAYQKISGVGDIKIIENMIEKYSNKGNRRHAIMLSAKNLLRVLKKYS